MEKSSMLALGANCCFGISAVYFALYSAKISALWVNTAKAGISLLALVIYFIIAGFDSLMIGPSLFPLLVSGIVGLCLGDYFLFKSFASLGAGRTLMLFGLQPIIFAFVGAFLFNEQLGLAKVIAIALMILCLFLFSFEKFKSSGSWELKGLLFAFLGVVLDGLGVFITKSVYQYAALGAHADSSQSTLPITGEVVHFYRSLGALVALLLMARWFKQPILAPFIKLQRTEKKEIVLACFFGTFLSLLMYLNAIKFGAIATVSAIAITGPLFASTFESLILRKRPSFILGLCLSIFCLAFYLFHLQ